MKHHRVDMVIPDVADPRFSFVVDGFKFHGVTAVGLEAAAGDLTTVTVTFYANLNCDPGEQEASVDRIPQPAPHGRGVR